VKVEDSEASPPVVIGAVARFFRFRPGWGIKEFSRPIMFGDQPYHFVTKSSVACASLG
jgi:hypothetical protein